MDRLQDCVVLNEIGDSACQAHYRFRREGRAGPSAAECLRPPDSNIAGGRHSLSLTPLILLSTHVHFWCREAIVPMLKGCARAMLTPMGGLCYRLSIRAFTKGQQQSHLRHCLVLRAVSAKGRVETNRRRNPSDSLPDS